MATEAKQLVGGRGSPMASHKSPSARYRGTLSRFPLRDFFLLTRRSRSKISARESQIPKQMKHKTIMSCYTEEFNDFNAITIHYGYRIE
jgi:hypothetical protein